MKKTIVTLFIIMLICVQTLVSANNKPPSKEDKQTLNQLGNETGLVFTPNKGQIIDMQGFQRPDILYKAKVSGLDIYLRKGGISYVLIENNIVKDSSKKKVVDLTASLSNTTNKKNRIHRVDVNFIGANMEAHTLNSKPLPGYTNYFSGKITKDQGAIEGINRYCQVMYKNLYPLIDISYKGAGQHGLKYDIIVHPGGNPSIIKQAWSGVSDLSIDKSGALIAQTPIKELNECLPRVYQEIKGKIMDVNAKYKVSRTKAGNYEVTLAIGKYNKNYDLIIDPWVTYLGGSGDELWPVIATDNNNNILVVGTTGSSDFPINPGLIRDTIGCCGAGTKTDIFVSSFSPSGTLNWSTYLGGEKTELAPRIAVDGNNNIIIVGTTNSNDFPILNAFQDTSKGGDLFITSINPNGLLNWSTYHGGSLAEAIPTVTIDNNNNVLVAGRTRSLDLPVTPGAFQSFHGGGNVDAFITSITSNGNLNWTTYLGGSGNEAFPVIATDGNNNVIITGYTPSFNFPLFNPYQPFIGGGIQGDLFISSFDDSGNINWSTFLGGSNDEFTPVIAIDNNNNVLIAGTTRSSDLPTFSPIQTWGGGIYDIVVASFASSGSINWCTFLGGDNSESNPLITTDGNNNVIVTGGTASTDLPTTSNAIQTTYSGGFLQVDGFATSYNSAGDKINWSTYFAGDFGFGTGDEEAHGIITDKYNNVSIVGNIESTNFPTSTCALQSNLGGSTDQFLIRFDSIGNYLCSTYMGGPSNDQIIQPPINFNNVALDTNGMILITGRSNGAGYPVTNNAYDTSFNGGTYDVWVSQLCPTTCGLFDLNMDFTASDTLLICGTTIDLTDSILICDPSGVSWLWSFPGGIPATSTDQNPTGIIYNTAGTYDVKLKIMTPCGVDSLTKTNYITVISANEDTIDPAGPLCINDQAISLTANSTGGIWTGTVLSSTTFSPTIAGLGPHQITYTSFCGSSDTIYIMVNPNPSVNLGADTFICGDNLILSVVSPMNNLSYLWSTGDTNTNTTINIEGSYGIIVSDSLNCTASDTIIVNACPNIYVPNAFSPNSDGYNDEFIIRGDRIADIMLKIYDRWGNIVLETTDINIKWAGTNKQGKELRNGVYVYSLNGSFDDGATINLKGNITLIR